MEEHYNKFDIASASTQLDPIKALLTWYIDSQVFNKSCYSQVEICTLDNPGWNVRIDMSTNFPERPFVNNEIYNSPDDWISCKVENSVFIGSGDKNKLNEILNIFITWTRISKVARNDKGINLTNFLSEWFISQCNGDWEHGGGITLKNSYDNKKWILEVDLEASDWYSQTLKRTLISINDQTIICEVSNTNFYGTCDAFLMLDMLIFFKDWIEMTKQNIFSPNELHLEKYGKILNGKYYDWYVYIHGINDDFQIYLVNNLNKNSSNYEIYNIWIEDYQDLIRYFKDFEWNVEWLDLNMSPPFDSQKKNCNSDLKN